MPGFSGILIAIAASFRIGRSLVEARASLFFRWALLLEYAAGNRRGGIGSILHANPFFEGGKTMSSTLRFFVCSAAACLLASCVESDRPLSDLSKSQHDTRLCGVWANTDERGDIDYLHIGAETTEPLERGHSSPEPGLMRYCTVTHTHQSQGLAKAGEGHFYSAKIGGEDFANWVIPANEAEHKPLTYCFLKYQVDDKQLILWDQDAEATARAIEDGKLKGIVKRKQRAGAPVVGEFDELRITDSTENIAAFLAGGGVKACFPDKPSSKTIYARVR
jgi:hypothetical protein